MQKHLLKPAIGLSIFALASAAALAQPRTEPRKPLTPVTEQMLLNPPAEDWLMWRRTYDAWGYSPLDRINKSNVKNLRVAWTWAMTTGATEITPIVHDGVLFLFNYADKVQALNATNGDLLWEYKRDLPAPRDTSAAPRVACPPCGSAG